MTADYILPELLINRSGKKAESIAQWESRRREILNILAEYEYGFSPPPPHVSGTISNTDEYALAGKAIYSVAEIAFDTPGGRFSFPLEITVPKKVEKPPMFLNISFRGSVPDRYYKPVLHSGDISTEEIIDNGFAIAQFLYTDITCDNDDFGDGLAGKYSRGQRKPDEWGKISMWAWAASRAMDYLQTLDTVAHNKIAVIGHSRLGKTALWCAAQDERFDAAISNESGCGGAALYRGKRGERAEDVIRVFPYWFCDNFLKYGNRENELPFDQHFLLAAIAPRKICVGSAMEDLWADPAQEFRCCLAAGPAYDLCGIPGLCCDGNTPLQETTLYEGNIGYHLREGRHYFSRYDLKNYMSFIAKK